MSIKSNCGTTYSNYIIYIWTKMNTNAGRSFVPLSSLSFSIVIRLGLRSRTACQMSVRLAFLPKSTQMEVPTYTIHNVIALNSWSPLHRGPMEGKKRVWHGPGMILQASLVSDVTLQLKQLVLAGVWWDSSGLSQKDHRSPFVGRFVNRVWRDWKLS